MRKSVKNCQKLNMQTIRVRRERPASLSIAMALAITMLIVYLLSIQSCPENVEAAAVLPSAAEVRMEGMETAFLLSSVHDDRTQANVAAAKCARNGGAGLVLQEEGQFSVVYEAGRDFPDADAPVILRRCEGLTLQIKAPADAIAAISDGIQALNLMITETASLADSMEKGECASDTVFSLLKLHQTRISRALETLPGTHAATLHLSAALESALEGINHAMKSPEPGRIRLLHAAGCAEWMELAGNLRALAE